MQRLRRCLLKDPGVNGLANENPRGKKFERDDERLLDDFVLLCFFIGNDFLPQLPCLSIPDGGLDLLLLLYARALPRSLGGYLTDDGGDRTRGTPAGTGRVHVKRVAALLSVVAAPRGNRDRGSRGLRRENERTSSARHRCEESEDVISTPPPRNERSSSARRRRENGRTSKFAETFRRRGSGARRAKDDASRRLGAAQVADMEPEILRRRARRDAPSSNPSRSKGPPDARRDALVEMGARACASSFAPLAADGAPTPPPAPRLPTTRVLRPATPSETAATKAMVDAALAKHAEGILEASGLGDVAPGQKGFRDRYYRKVLAHGPNPKGGDREANVSEIACEYWRGVRFVAEYYHRGCASWTWIYPWHYAPLARDLAKVVLDPGDGLKRACHRLDRGRPLLPLQQLMAVLPPASAHCCPPEARRLMTEPHSELAPL